MATWKVLFVLEILCAASVSSVTVTTGVGDIVGQSLSWRNITINKFFGIPYAEPPIGSLRFQPPVAKAAFATPYSADRFGASCIQYAPMVATLENKNISEDCLSLNLYVPQGGAVSKAVMVWIYGGGFVFGSSQGYDGTKMAADGDVIVVTLNYRIGIFGFFNLGDAVMSGNYGLLDQQLALKWVNKNIGAFGGDVNRVLIFGESAGSASVTWQMLAPSNRGLFQRAISESGAASAAWSFSDPKVNAEYRTHVLKALGCTNGDSRAILGCLQALKTQDFGQESTEEWPFNTFAPKVPEGPRVDGVFIRSSPTCRNPGHRIEDMPFFRSIDYLVGANKYEGSPFFKGFNDVRLMMNKSSYFGVISESDFKEFTRSVGVIDDEKEADILWEGYSAGRSQLPDGRELLEFLGDAFFYKDVMVFADGHADSTTASTYFYSFLPRPSKQVGLFDSSVTPVSPYVDGAIHADELGFILGNATMWEPGSNTPGENELSDAMITYWTNFAKSGNPNTPAPVPYQWPEYKKDDQHFIELDIKNDTLDLRTSSSYRGKYMEYWKNIAPRLNSLCITSGSASARPRDITCLFFVLAVIAFNFIRKN